MVTSFQTNSRRGWSSKPFLTVIFVAREGRRPIVHIVNKMGSAHPYSEHVNPVVSVYSLFWCEIRKNTLKVNAKFKMGCFASKFEYVGTKRCRICSFECLSDRWLEEHLNGINHRAVMNAKREDRALLISEQKEEEQSKYHPIPWDCMQCRVSSLIFI